MQSPQIILDTSKLIKFVDELSKVIPFHVNICNVLYLLIKPWTYTGFDERYRALMYKTYTYLKDDITIYLKYDENEFKASGKFVIKAFLAEFKSCFW